MQGKDEVILVKLKKFCHYYITFRVKRKVHWVAAVWTDTVFAARYANVLWSRFVIPESSHANCNTVMFAILRTRVYNLCKRNKADERTTLWKVHILRYRKMLSLT